MGVSSKQSSKKSLRSLTLPCRSHPNKDRMEKLLNQGKTLESTVTSSNPSAEMICNGFSHLTALYECLEDLFNTNPSQTSTAFSNHTMKWTDGLLDISVKFLDICSNTTDAISQTKQHLRDFGCDLRRNGGCNSTDSIIARYIEFRNKLKKDIKRSMASLKQVDNMIRGSLFKVDSENHHLMWVISVFREVASFSIIFFRFLLEFLAVAPLKRRRTGRWTALSRYLSNGKVVPEGKLTDASISDLQRLDSALLRCCSSEKTEFIQDVSKNLETLEATLEGINSHLHLMSRGVIATRVCILNMVSFY